MLVIPGAEGSDSLCRMIMDSVPTDEVCKETSQGSGIFVREWSKATVQMDVSKQATLQEVVACVH